MPMLDATSTSPSLGQRIDVPMAWTASTIRESDWRIPVPSACIDELKETLAILRREEMPMLVLDPLEYPLAACARLMRETREHLDHVTGIVVLDRFPVEEYTQEETRKLFWLMGNLLGRTVSQSIQGEMMVSVRDTGIAKRVGVRGFRTNYPQKPHTDNSFNHCPPDYVSLLSLNKAVEGGVSHFEIGRAHV